VDCIRKPLHDIQKEEERLQEEEIANARASRKRRNEAISISDDFDDADDEENAAPDGKVAAIDETKGDLGGDDDDADKRGALPLLSNVDNNADAINNNHPQRMVECLTAQVTQLENTIV